MAGEDHDTCRQASDSSSAQGGADRTRRVMNVLVNTSIILMSGLMGGFSRTMIEMTDAMASGMVGAKGGEGMGKEEDEDVMQKLPEIDDNMKEMISGMRRDVYLQMEQKRREMEPLLADPVFDLGPRIIDEYDFSMPKLTEELDDSSLARYSQLFASEDPSFMQMFERLTLWMDSLPNPSMSRET